VRAPRLSTGLLTGGSLAIALFVHPYTFFELVVPMGVLYGTSRSQMSRSARGAVYAMAAFAIAANAYWLLPSLRFLDYLLDSSYYHLAGISTLLYDFLELAVNLDDTALFSRTALRFLVWGLGAAGLWFWRRDQDDRFLPFGSAVLVLLAESYLGRYTPITAQIQPYRFVVPATLLLALPAADFVTSERVRAAVTQATGPARALFATLGVATLQLLVHDIAYYFPAMIPAQVGADLQPNEIVTPTGYPRQLDIRHRPPPGEEPSVRWFEAQGYRDGRILVEPPVLGERLAALLPDAQIMGGIRERNLTHAHSNLFRRYPNRDAPPEALARYLERYAVRWVVLESRKPLPVSYAHLLKVRASLPDLSIYEATTPVSFFEQGSGHARAAMNRIQVSGTDPAAPIVLRYHWLETLVCEPSCKLERAPASVDAVAFIRIPAPHPRDFVVRNAY
jgi:hypothetical protein